MTGLNNFLEFVVNNWTSIFIIIVLIVAMVKKVVDYFKKSKEERIEIVKEQIRQVVLKLVMDAELDYEEWKKSGAIKRSQVIQELFDEFPVLAEVTDQEQLLAWIDSIIDEALETMRDILAKNETEGETPTQPEQPADPEQPEEQKQPDEQEGDNSAGDTNPDTETENAQGDV